MCPNESKAALFVIGGLRLKTPGFEGFPGFQPSFIIGIGTYVAGEDLI